MLDLLAAAASPPVWPTVLSASIGAVAVLGSAIFAGIVQRKSNRAQADQAEQKRQDDATSTNIAAQVDLTKDVLDNWKDIVRSLGQQISDLHGQVEALEDRERRCQVEKLTMQAQLLKYEGQGH